MVDSVTLSASHLTTRSSSDMVPACGIKPATTVSIMSVGPAVE